MGDVIQLPRQHPGRRWSPTEILAIKEPHDTGQQVRQERSRIATTKKIAEGAGKRQSKRARRKKAIADILSTDPNQKWTVTVLMGVTSKWTRQRVSRATVTELLKELEAEGLACNINQFWWKSTNK